MRKQHALMVLLAALILAAAPAARSAERPPGPAALFPELDGWTRDGGVAVFLPENLYEHINGAAENFLAYGFRELAVQNYADPEKRSLSAEIYFHGTAENAFGIYSSEKPLAGDYLKIGAQGYVEEGVLNFISDAYYVKLNGFDLGAAGREILLGLARSIAAAIRGSGRLPETLDAFPARGRVAHSERYSASNFLGHDFLLPAFSADYELAGEKFQLFVMKAGSAEQAGAMLCRYAALDKGLDAAAVRPGKLTIRDPYNGSVRLEWRDRVIWGAVGGAADSDDLLAELARNLAGRQQP